MSRLTVPALAVIAALGLAASARADRGASVRSANPFVDGPLPGSPQIVIKLKPSKQHCGGTVITASLKKSKKTSAPDKELAAVFLLPFPTGLDFDPSKESKRKASMKKFETWYRKLDDASKQAAVLYFDIVKNTGVAPADAVVAAARTVQVARWSMQVLARAVIPTNVAKHAEAAQIYCDSIAEKAEPLGGFAVEAARTCRDLAANTSVGAGWWDAVCAE